jgi:signal transduction histidine kinase
MAHRPDNLDPDASPVAASAPAFAVASGTADGQLPDRPVLLGLTARTGLQGKLVLCFVFLLAAALGASCWLFAAETREAFDRVTDEQAAQLARTLAMAGEPPLDRGDAAELQRIGAELLKNKGLVAVAFFDAAGRQVAAAARDPDLERPDVGFFVNPRDYPLVLRESRQGWTAALGRYVSLTTPVVRLNSRPRGDDADFAAGTATGSAARAAGQLVGYVTVCVSHGDADARARNVALMVVLIGAVAVLVSLPTMYFLVHRIFAPIRQLVTATDRIAAGDLSAGVAIDRPDVIGTLARSFNQMVNRVRGQQWELELANHDLADANARLEAANARLADANARLAEANRDLEGRVAARTADLERANRRLHSEMADKDEFLRTVSHDLNAPLRNIDGMAAMLLMKHRESFDPDVVYRLERIQKNVQVETALIGELLELSRIKSRRQTFQDVDLGELVAEVADVFAQDLETRRIALTVDTAMPRLTCEPARLRQVFQNLVDNAVKYMGDGSTADALRAAGHPIPSAATGSDPVREIRLGCTVAGGGAAAGDVEFYVRDTGIGIDPADAANVFRVFRRGTSQAVQAVAGKGVGLASVKSIVETYGGTIRVDGTPGAGCTFRFTVDRKHLSAAAGGQPAARAA